MRALHRFWGVFTHVLSRMIHFYPLTPRMCQLGVRNVGLSLSLNFDNPVATQSFNLNLQIDETPNAGTCAYFSITPCADKIFISETSMSNQFSVAGIDYTLQLLGFSLTPGGTPINEFISQEGGTNEALLFAKVTAAGSEQVPEPATVAGTALWLLAARWAVGNKRKKVYS